MKLHLRFHKIYLLLLAGLLLLQSCGIYNSRHVSLEEAANSGKKVKMISTKGERIIFYRIEQKDSLFYGKQRSDKKSPVPIAQEHIRSLRLHNKTASIVGTSILGFFTLFTVGFFFLLHNFDYGERTSNDD